MKPKSISISVANKIGALAWRNAALIPLLFLCGAGPTSVLAATLTWTGAISTDWNNRTNWSPQLVPTNTDTAVINSGTVVSATNSQFNALTFNGGNISGPVVVGTNCVMNWTGGRLAQGSSLTVLTNGVVNLTGSTEKDLAGPMTNFGQVVLSGTGFYVQNDNSTYLGWVTNLGLWTLQGDLTLGSYWGNGSGGFGNRGILRKATGSGIGVVSVGVTNGPAGTVDVESGTLRFDGGMRLDGTNIAAAGTVMAFNAGTFVYVPPNRLTGAGQYQFTGGTLQGLDDYLSNFQLLGGTVFLSPNYQTNGVILRFDMNGATLGGTSNRVVGVLNATNGGISSVLDVAASAVVNLSGTYVYGATTVRSNGTINWSGGRFAQGSSLLIQSNALVNLLSGNEKDMAGPMNNYGKVVQSGGNFYVMNDGASWPGLVVNLGIWELQGDVGIGSYFGTDYATFSNAGRFRKTAGTGAASISLPFYNTYGAVEAWSGTLRFDHGQQLDGLFMAEAGAVIAFNSGTFTCTPATSLTGAGGFQLTGGTLTGLTDFLPNLQLLGGTVYLSATYQTNGAIVRLDLNGATLGGAIQVSGVLNFNSGYVSGPLTVRSNAVLNWNSGRFAQGSALLIQSNAVVNLLTSGEKDLGGPMTNYGSVLWTNGVLYVLNDGATWAGTIENAGLWDIRGDLSIANWFGNNYDVFQNNGLLRKSAGIATATQEGPFQNQSTIEPRSGVLAISRGLSSTAGKMTFGLSASSAYGQITVTGAASVNGSLGARLLNGYIPDPGLSFPVVSATTLAGTFTNIDGLQVGFGRVLTPAYTATTLTLQSVVTNGVNHAPTWTAVPNFSLIEGQTLLYTNQVSDQDGNQVLFKLLSAPSGVVLGVTNGVLNWTPTEVQGGTSNNLTAYIFDSGNPSLGSTQSFYVLVLKTNTAPVLPVIATQLIGVGGLLTVTNTAVDTDVPANSLTNTLLSAPAGMTVDANGIITWNPSNAGNYQVTMRVTDNGTPALSATNSFTVGVIAAPVPPAGLVSWWTGNGTTADKQGANDGSLSGTASYAAGLFGQAFNFNGGYLTVLDSPTLDFAPGSALTVEMWVKRTQAGVVPYYFGKRVSCGSYNYQSPSDQYSPGTAFDAPVGQWRHMAWVFTGAELLGYVNGALVYRTESTLGPVNAAALFIGTSGTCGSTFVGLVDEVRIYNRALSPAEIQTVYGAQGVGAPVLTQQPISQLAASGSNVTLSASATGAAVLSYQWWYNGAPLAGQVSPTLPLNAVTVGKSGNYSVVVSNSLGVLASDAAELAVMDAPVVTNSPQSQPGSVGGSVTFTASASGSVPLTYSWRKNGTPLGSVSAPSLTLGNLQVADSGTYDVVVYNWVGSSTSQVAILTVSAPLLWTGAVSSDWNNKTNWNPQQVPTSIDTAVINSGNVVAAANSQFYALTFTGGNITGPVVVGTNCVMNWSGGHLAQGSSLTVLTNGLVNLTGSAEKDLAGPMTNFGQVVLSGTSFYLQNDNNTYLGSVTNLGLWTLQGDLTLGSYWGNGSGPFGNRGILRKTAGSGIGVVSVGVTNGPAGTVDVESGTLRFDGGMRLDGTFIAATGTVMAFYAGTFICQPPTPAHFTGAGQYQLTGGTLQGLDDYLSNFQLLGGTVNLSPNYQTNGVIVRLDLAGATLAGTSNRVVGVLNAVNGAINGVLDVAANAMVNLSGTYVYGATTVRSNGTLNWSSGRFAQGSSLLIQSNALVNLLSGNEKDMAGPMNNYGKVVQSGGGFYIMNDGASWPGTVVNLGIWELQGDVGIGSYFGTDYAVFGNGGRFRKTAGTGIASISLPFYNTYGAVEVWSGTLQFNHGQQLDGLFTAEAGTAVQFNAGTFTYTPPGRFTGSGLYQLTGGTLNGLTDFLPNWQLLGGTVTLSSSFQTNGAIVRLDLNGATLAGTNQVSGVLNFNSGYISGPLTVISNSVLNWNGGRFAQGSSLLVQSNALLNLLTSGEKDLGGPMSNYGAVVWTSGPLYLLNDGATWAGTIRNAGLWETRGDLPIANWFGNNNAVFQNTGLLRKSAGTATATLDCVFLNQSAIEPLSGVLAFSRGLSSTAGTITFGLTTNNNYGQMTVSGTASVNGSLAARLLNGYIPDPGLNFPVLSAGTLSGTFTNTDGLQVGFGRVLTPAYTATTLTLQSAVTNGVNHAPTWTAVPNFSLLEGQALLYTNQVNDQDGDQVLFKLVSAPSGAVLGLTNGVLSWVPSEAQGGTSNYFTARIFDSGNPSLGATQSFYVLVAETNTAPVLPVIPPQLVGVGGILTVTNTAVDTDIPANTLSYTLLLSPPGMSVDANGIITWAPTNVGNFPVTLRVADNGTPPLSATNSFTVGVIALPTPPPGLISWWTGDGTTADKQGLNDGTLTGAAGYGAGLFGQAFNLSGGYLTVPDSPGLDFAPGSAMTVEMWVKRTQAGSVPYYFGKRVACSSYNYESPSDLIGGAYWNVPVGQWQHLVWVFTGAEMLGYVNGALVYRTESTMGPVNAVPLFIGASGTCGATFVGLIDEVRIYNRALNLDEILTVYGAQNVGAPVLTRQPASQMAVSGSNVTLNVSATGAPALSYQWWYNGGPLGGQTSTSLPLNAVTVPQLGNYRVVVSNALGVIASDVAGLTVLDAPVITVDPQTQPGVVGGSVTFTVTATGTPTPSLSYQWRKNATPLSGATGTALTLNNLLVPDSGTYDVVVANWAGTAVSHGATLVVSTPIVWTGVVSTDWNNRTNWNPQQVPTVTDTAVINSGNVVFPTNGVFYALTFNGGYLYGPVVVGSNSLMYWTGGRLAQGSSLTLLSNAVAYLTGSTEKDLAGPMTNFGQVVLSGTSFYVMNDNSTYQGSVTNLGTWLLQGDVTLGAYWGNGTGTIGNSGIFRKSTGNGVGVVGPFVYNGPTGTVDVKSGTLRFDGGLRMDGLLTTAPGTVMAFNAGTFTYVPGNRLTGSGQYQFTGGTLQGLDDYLANFQLLGGTVFLSPNYQTNGAIVRLDLNGATLGNTSNRVVGVLNATNGGISGVLDVAAYAVANLSGTYAYGATTIRSNATLNWLGGRFAQGSSLLIQSNALANLLGNTEKDLAGPMTNYGHVVMSGGSFYVMSDNSSWLGSVTNLGTWDMQGDLTIGSYFGTDYAAFSNGSLFRKTAGVGIGVISLPFYNTQGTVDVESGTLRFDHGIRLDGSFVAAAGCVMAFNSGTFTWVPPSRFTGGGLYQLTGGTLQGLDNFVPNLQLLGGTVALSLTYQTNGPIVRLDLNGSTLAGSNQVVGLLNATNGGISGALSIASNGVVNLNGTYAYGPTTVRSNATLNWFGGRFAQGSSLLVQSNALVNLLSSAEKDMGGAMTNYGHVVMTGGGLYVMNDNSGWQGSITNLGVWDLQGDVGIGQYFGTGYETFVNQGSFRKTAGTGIGVISLTFNNVLGTVDVVSGTLRFDHGASLDGQFMSEAGAVIQFNTGTFLYKAQTHLTGSGLYQLTGGTLQGLADYLPNLQLLGGNVALSSTYQTNGTIARLDLSGATLTGTNRVTGIMNLLSGYVSGPMSIKSNGVLNWSSGRFAQGSTLTIETNGLANLLTTGGKELGGAMTNAGQVEWTGGSLSLINDAATFQGAIVNLGLWEIQGDLSMGQYYVNNYSSFQNSGTLRKPIGPNTATMDVVFYNSGAIEQLSGIWTFGRNFSLTEGTVLFGLAGDSTFGQINLTGTASLAGHLAARLLNGYVPNTNRTFQVMSYGVVAGTFTDYSGLDVGSGRAFAPAYTATSLTLQTYATNSTSHPTPIVLSNPHQTLSGFTFQFTGDIGRTYTVQYSTNLSTLNWRTLLVTNIPVSLATVTDTNPVVGKRFYRVFLNGSTAIVLSNPSKGVSGFSFFFTGDPGSTYTVQYSTNLGQTNWSTLLVTNITVSPTKVTDASAPALKRFYRVLR